MTMEAINMVEERLRRRKIQHCVLRSSSVERDRGDDLEEDIKELEPVTTENRDNDKSSLGSKIQGKCLKRK